MSELKTLKDIEYWENNNNYVESNELRQELIKWIKELKKSKGDIKFDNGIAISWNGKPNDLLAAIYILEHIFNITDKELK